MKMLVPNLKVKQGIKDFRSATKSATGAETQGADTEMERIANWIEMMNSDLAVDQHIALSTLVQAELGDEAKARIPTTIMHAGRISTSGDAACRCRPTLWPWMASLLFCACCATATAAT